MKSRLHTPQCALAVVLITALCCLSVVAMANGHGAMPKKQPAPKPASSPAMVGRGPVTVSITTFNASSVGNCAWIYTQTPMTCAPMQTSGLIQATAIKGPLREMGVEIKDNANVLATFNYPNSGCTYQVQFTGLASAGELRAPVGGIVIQETLGGMTIWGVEFPRTLAYGAVVGRATIMRNNQVVATNEPAIMAITHAIHDQSSRRIMSSADSSRKEIHLIVPGALVDGGTAIPGFPNGGFYVYWPSAQFNVETQQITIPGQAVAPVPMGKGPEVPGSLMIDLTNQGISKKVGTAPFGLYDITVRNVSDKSQGLYMTGTDICCTEFKRFSKILKPGQSQKFRFFFAAGKVVMRPFCCAVKTPTSYADYSWTGPATSIVFE